MKGKNTENLLLLKSFSLSTGKGISVESHLTEKPSYWKGSLLNSLNKASTKSTGKGIYLSQLQNHEASRKLVNETSGVTNDITCLYFVCYRCCYFLYPKKEHYVMSKSSFKK